MRYYTLPAVAEALRCDLEVVRSWAAHGLPTIQPGSEPLVFGPTLEAWLCRRVPQVPDGFQAANSARGRAAEERAAELLPSLLAQLPATITQLRKRFGRRPAERAIAQAVASGQVLRRSGLYWRV